VDPPVETKRYLATGPPYASALVGADFAEISMTAQPGVDPQGSEVSYKFFRIDPDTGLEITSSGWTTSLTWIDGKDAALSLVPGEEYTYYVRMRDASENVSAPSGSFTAIAEIVPNDGDIWAPVIAVPAWAAPISRWDDEFGVWDAMEAAEAVDDGDTDVEYYFEDADSGEFRDWSTDPTWTVSISSINVPRYYRYKVRDTSQGKNVSGWTDMYEMP
jgi:hypothetical protein